MTQCVARPLHPFTDDLISRLLDEGPIGLTQAAKHIGTFREGKPTRAGTLARWALHGIRLADGSVLKLESFRLNGRLCTSKPALLRFIAAQNTGTAPTLPTTTSRRAASPATAELDRVMSHRAGA